MVDVVWSVLDGDGDGLRVWREGRQVMWQITGRRGDGARVELGALQTVGVVSWLGMEHWGHHQWRGQSGNQLMLEGLRGANGLLIVEIEARELSFDVELELRRAASLGEHLLKLVCEVLAEQGDETDG